ncbi:MAG TPA: hypothetical protein VGZ47_04535 [Gemmataceae bacterium]|jgi:hypothetical protein|nr:hypothetical protein [Gemmataceae bacterium]
MSISTPDWLSLHGGYLRRGLDHHVWLVMLNGTPQYQLVITPAHGQFTCALTQLNNAKRLDKGAVYATAEAALQGGLEELKQTLGWG